MRLLDEAKDAKKRKEAEKMSLLVGVVKRLVKDEFTSTLFHRHGGVGGAARGSQASR